MKIPTKKLKNGFEMPIYGIGTWKMGENSSEFEKETDVIKKAIELGVTHIDTAEVYADGKAEKVIGYAIKKYDRKKLFLVSKVFGNHLEYESLLKSVKQSLERLNTDYLDLYLLHRFNPQVPLQETMSAMDWLYEQKIIRNIGISNYTVKQTIMARKASKYLVVANQLHLNLKNRETEKKGLLEYCQKEDMMFIAWRPLKDVELNIPIISGMTKKYKKTPSQIAINWLISQQNVVTLSKTSNIEHLRENLGSLDFEMEKEDIEKLRNYYPNQRFISDTVPLLEN
ncbi:MAG: hypothetical protein A2171_01305 [Candidatus Levybacteria bacterium RBG_13_35_9]|nr:MAG: hypothetical protein A2171_01305 [Candidatus Levybacteria bacterium RBG_13_35_9]